MKTIFFSIATLLFAFTIEAQQLRLSLQQCREMALEYSEDMKIAQYQIEKAITDRQIARTAYLPRFSASATYARTSGDMELGLPQTSMPFTIMEGVEVDIGEMLPEKITTNTDIDLFMLGVNVQQPLFAGGKILIANRMAEKAVELTEENIRMLRSNVAAEAEKAYWRHYSLNYNIRLLEQYDILLDTLYHSVSAMISVQMATDNELLKITSRRSNIQYQMQRARNGMELSRMQLCRLIGADLNTEIILTDSISTSAATAPPTDMFLNLTARPEYRMLQRQIELHDLNIKSVRADFLPTLGVMAGYSYMSDLELGGIAIRTGRPRPLLMASLNIPIFHFGEGAKKIQSATIVRNIQQEELNKNSTLLTIEAQFANRNMQDAFLLIRFAETALQQAQANLRRTQDNYEVGMGTLIDVLDAQAQWQEAYGNLIDAQVQYKISEVEYLRVSGGM